MCLFVPYFLRGPLTDLLRTWWVYVGWPPICPWGFFFEKVKWSTGQWVTFTFHYIIYAPASRHTAAKRPFCFAAAESNSAPFAALHFNGVRTWTSQLPLRGSFSKRSTGRRVNGSNRSMGQRLLFRKHQQVDGSTGHFHFHYIIYDSRRCQAHATPLQKAHSVFCLLDG